MIRNEQYKGHGCFPDLNVIRYLFNLFINFKKNIKVKV